MARQTFREDGRPRNGGLLGPIIDHYAVRANTILCPFCQKRINKEAVKCGFCGEWLVSPEQATLIAEQNKLREQWQGRRKLLFWAGVIGLLVFAVVLNSPSETIARSGMNVSDTPSSEAPLKSAPKPLTGEELRASIISEAQVTPEKFLSLSHTRAWKGGFDTVMLLSGTLKNSAPIPIKDPQVTCYVASESGTTLGSVTETVFKIIPAGKSVHFKSANMGFVDSRWQRYGCAVVSATAAMNAG